MGSDARVIEYPVWVWDADSHDKAPTSGEMAAWKIDVGDVLETKKNAIAAHASQMTRLISDDPEGFVMTAEQLSRFTGNFEIFFEPKESTEDKTLGSGYFEGMYEREEDPWQFATSSYEAAKYRDTLEALTRERYGNSLELGCSIGVFTEMLAKRVERLIAIDASETAIARARIRCASVGNIDLGVAFVPDDWPPGQIRTDRGFGSCLLSFPGRSRTSFRQNCRFSGGGGRGGDGSLDTFCIILSADW